MTKKYTRALFIFRRDLRLEDNTGLILALSESEQVIPCFIFDPAQIGSTNRYKSDNVVQFMVESLDDLNEQLKAHDSHLYFFHDEPASIVEKLIANKTIDAVFVNKDYTPYSKKRDAKIESVCKKAGIDFISSKDLLINDPEDFAKQDGTPYTVYTPFMKSARKNPVPKPVSNRRVNYFKGTIEGAAGISLLKEVPYEKNDKIFVHGGRSEAKKLIAHLEQFKNYSTNRDIPSLEGTTKLSAHMKFGTLSIRETYAAFAQALGSESVLINQLYWRDFFTHIAHHYPHVFGNSFQEKYENIEWENDRRKFTLWCQGRTGFPIVDAGMRQLNETGWMHNRVRMIVASFLTKDLHIDWRWGEQYFAIKLVDYDPAVNNGSWQWAASTGCDAQPYFRIFNPWLQQKKFDPDAAYIRRWIPEIRNLSAAQIHEWDRCVTRSAGNYPKPMLEHSTESKKAIARFKAY